MYCIPPQPGSRDNISAITMKLSGAVALDAERDRWHQGGKRNSKTERSGGGGSGSGSGGCW